MSVEGYSRMRLAQTVGFGLMGLIMFWGAIQDRSGIVFTTTKGKPVKDAYIRKMMRQKAIKASIEKIITFHSLRHTSLTRLYEKTKDIRLVQEVAGHSDISTTMVYTHISGADIREAMINL